MSTARQIKKLILPLLNRNHDLILVESTILYLAPIHHVARVIRFRRSAASYFNVEWCLIEQFIPYLWWRRTSGWCYEGIPRSLQSREEGGGGGNWCWADPTMPADFVAQVETIALPLLRSLDTLEACATFMRHHLEAKWCMGQHWPLAVDVSLGDLDAARTMWDVVGRHHQRPTFPPDRQAGPDRFHEIGAALMANDRFALADILHAVEAENVVGSPIEPYWRPTPFPLEM